MNSQVETLKKIRANFNSFKELWLFMKIFLFITALPPIFKILSLPMLMKLLTPKSLNRQSSLGLDEARDKIVKFTDYILFRNFWIYRNTCLKRSLVLYHFLRKSGINVHLCFGVKLPGNEAKKKLEGHAWLTYKGSIYLEKNIEAPKLYKMTYCFPEDREQFMQSANLKQP